MLERTSSGSSNEKTQIEKLEVERRGSTASVRSRVESLHDLPDPDVGKSPEERAKIDKALMWKVDRWLIPWLCLLYLLSFLDRTNIGNARLARMEKDLHMGGHDYNNALTIFFVSYALAEPVTNVILKRVTPRVFFTAIILLWGLLMTMMGLVTNKEGLLACRFLLGLAEAGLFPGVNYYLSCWYKRSELGIRAATFFSAAALAGSFGGLLAAAIALMDGVGGKPGWAWIFIIEGLATMFVGVFCWWMVFDWPDTARFLTPEERLRVRRRLAADNQSSTGDLPTPLSGSANLRYASIPLGQAGRPAHHMVRIVNQGCYVMCLQSLLIDGRGQYNCSIMGGGGQASGDGKTCNATNAECSPLVLPVKPGKTYRLRIASVASLSALNFLIQGHKMTVVEADGHYVMPVVVENLDVYSGESYSVLITADQNPANNYWAALNVRGRPPRTPTGLAVLNYLPNPSAKPPTAPPPPSPAWNDFAYSKSLARKFVARGGLEPLPPPKSDRQLILLNTQNRIGGYLKWAINNISLLPPSTPYLAAMKYRIRGAYNATPPPDVYQPRHYNIFDPPTNPNAAYGSGVYTFRLNSVVDVVLQNANTLTVNNSEIHPWHLHGHDFWILGFGDGVFDPQRDPRKYNLINPPLRNTVPLFPYGWTAIRFRADNPGVWPFHCHLEAHLFMGMAVMFAEGIDRLQNIPRSAMGCGLTRKVKPHH